MKDCSCPDDDGIASSDLSISDFFTIKAATNGHAKVCKHACHRRQSPIQPQRTIHAAHLPVSTNQLRRHPWNRQTYTLDADPLQITGLSERDSPWTWKRTEIRFFPIHILQSEQNRYAPTGPYTRERGRRSETPAPIMANEKAANLERREQELACRHLTGYRI